MQVVFIDGTTRFIDADDIMCPEGTTLVRKRKPWKDEKNVEHPFQVVEELETRRIRTIT